MIHKPQNETDIIVRVDDMAGTAANDWEMIAQAIAKAKEVGATQLLFSPREYHVGGASGWLDNAQVVLEGLSDFTVDGNGAVIVCRDIKPGISISNCQRLVLRNLTLDWDAVLATPGTVEKKNGETTIHIQPGYVTDGLPVTSVSTFDREAWAWDMQAYEVYNPANVEEVSPGVYRSQAFSGFLPGADVLVRHYVYEGTAAVHVFGRDTQDITLEKVTVLQCPSHAFLFSGCGEGIHVDGCVIRRGDETRPISATADGLHISAGKGNILIENCDFSYMGDDSINIHGKWYKSVSVQGQQIVVKGTPSVYSPLEVGDPITLHAGGNLTRYGEAVVTKLSTLGQFTYITLDREVPEAFVAGDVVGNRNCTSSGFVIRNNYFHDHRARGMLLQAMNGRVENNTIENVQAAAIQITTDCDYWLEGFGCEDIVIRGNRLIGVNKSRSPSYRMDRHPAALNVVVDTPTGLGDYPLHQRIIIEDNEIIDTPGAAMLIASAAEVTVRNNTITDAGYDPYRQLGHAIGKAYTGIVNVLCAQDVLLENNTFDNVKLEPIVTEQGTCQNITVR